MFPVVHFLKCVVTKVVLFSIIAFKTLDISQGSVATHFKCVGLFSDYKFSPDSDSEIILQSCMLISGNVKAYKNMDCQFLGHPVLVKNDDYYTPGIIRFEH